MRFLGSVVMMFAVVHALSSDTLAQTRPPQTGRAASEPLLDIVEVVGCLTTGPNGSWTLSNASAPRVERRPGSTADSVKAAAAKSLGTQRFRLLNIAVFNPGPHQGHMMAVRGILLKDAKDPRINLTSFQMVDTACVK